MTSSMSPKLSVKRSVDIVATKPSVIIDIDVGIIIAMPILYVRPSMNGLSTNCSVHAF